MLHAPSLDYIFSSVHVKNISPTAPQEDAWPRCRSERLPLNIHKTVMTTHVMSPFRVAQNAALTPLYGRNCYIHQMSHSPPPQHKKCFKPSDHLMYILNIWKGGLHTGGSPPPPSETLTTNRAPGPTQENQKKCLYQFIYYISQPWSRFGLLFLSSVWLLARYIYYIS